MSFVIEEAKIVSPSINSHKELIFRIRIKPEDYSTYLVDKIYEAASNGTPFAVAFQEFQNDEVEFDPIPTKRQKLHATMQMYCQKEGIDISNEKQRLYGKYEVTSRSELTEAQLDEEIKTYQAGLMFE